MTRSVPRLNMNNYAYVIANKIEFIPGKRLLRKTNTCHDNIEVNLNRPASKCLHLLLSTKGLVDHNMLYTCGWGEKGIDITPNNLYQTISILRRALCALDDNEIITTITRKGFCINDKIEIKSISFDAYHANLGTNNSGFKSYSKWCTLYSGVSINYAIGMN